MTGFRLLVCGGRNYADWVKVQNVLTPYFETHAHEMIVIEGGATGADTLARKWARNKGIHVATVEANWNWWREIGAVKRAGYARNLAMTYLEPHKVVAFPGGNGTANMVKLAQDNGIEVEIV